MEKTRIREAIVAALIAFVIPVLFSGISLLIRDDSGWYTAGRPIDTSAGMLQFLDIYNQSSSTLDDLIVSVTIHVEPRRIRSSSPLSFGVIDSQGNEEILLSISSVPPDRLTRIAIPLDTAGRNAAVPEIINAAEVGLEKVNAADLPRPQVDLIRETLLNAVGSALFIGIVIYIWMGWFQRTLDETKSASERAIERSETALKGLKDTKKYIENMKKYALLQHARVSDLTKELDFWRDTIRKLIVEVGKKLDDGDTLVELVTRNLKTYSTARKADFEQVRVLAGLLRDAEKA